MENFTDQLICKTFQKVIHLSDDNLFVDGTGSLVQPKNVFSGSVEIYESGSLVSTNIHKLNFVNSTIELTGSNEVNIIHEDPQDYILSGIGNPYNITATKENQLYLDYSPNGYYNLWGWVENDIDQVWKPIGQSQIQKIALDSFSIEDELTFTITDHDNTSLLNNSPLNTYTFNG